MPFLKAIRVRFQEILLLSALFNLLAARYLNERRIPLPLSRACLSTDGRLRCHSSSPLLRTIRLRVSRSYLGITVYIFNFLVTSPYTLRGFILLNCLSTEGRGARMARRLDRDGEL